MSQAERTPKTAPRAGAKAKPLFDRETVNEIKADLARGLEYRAAPRAKARAARPAAPKKAHVVQPMESIYLKIADEKISMRQGDEVKQVSVREATARAHLKTALGGNARALADVTRQIALADASRAAELAEDHAFWRAYRVHTLAQIAQAKSNGEPEPLILPHPEDIVIREGEPVRFKGPTDAAALKKYEETCRLRDHMFLWEELDERRRRKQARKGLPSPDGAALLFMDMLERGLPLRMQLTEAERYRHELNARRMTKRELLKTLHAGWRALGHPRPRGALPPSMDDAVKVLKSHVGLFNALSSGELDADRIINGDIDERMEDVLVRLGFPRGHLTGG